MSHAADSRIDAVVAALTAPGGSAWVTAPRDLVESRALRHALAAAGWRVLVLDRAPVVDKATLLHACYQSGEYPAGFGFNWDALADAVGDLTDTLVAVGPTPHLPPGVRDTLLAVLDHAAASAAPSLTVLCSPPESTP